MLLSLRFIAMSDINIWLLAGTGLFAGIYGSMLGLGGGLLIVPILTLTSPIPIQFAIGSSLVSIVINSCTATSVYIRNHMTNLKLGLLLCTTLIPGAAVGALLGSYLPASTLTFIFGILLIYMAYIMLSKNRNQLSAEKMQRQNISSTESVTSHTWSDNSYYDPALGREVNYHVHRPVIGLVTSLLGGALSSMLGIGGGIINVPVMHILMKIPDKAAIATSSIMLAFTAMTGATIYAFHGFIMPYLIAPLCIGVYVGSRVGTELACRIKGTAIIIIFSITLALISVLMILEAVNLIGS